MINSELLKEAIADAKAVRATALANAKAALEEAFAPRFEAMFAEKIKEEAEEDQEESVAEVSAPHNVTAGGGDASPGKTKDVTKGQPKKKYSGKDFKPVKAGKGPSDVGNLNQPVMEAAEEEEEGKKVEEGYEEEEEGKRMDEAGLTSEDLDEIIKELEAECAGEEEGQPHAEPDGDEAPMAASPVPAPAPAPAAPIGEVPPIAAPAAAPAPAPVGGELPPAPAPAPEAPVAGDEEDINLDELLAALNEESEEEEEGAKMDEAKHEEDDEEDEEDEGKKVEESKGNHGVPTSDLKGQDKAGGVKGYPTTTSNKEIEANKNPNHNIQGKGNIGSGESGGKPKMEEMAKYKVALKESYKTIEYLRGQINEVNLLNAKLLYTNRLFKEFAGVLDDPYRMKIIESFDLTKNVREVKLAYALLKESLNFGTKVSAAVKPTTKPAVQKETVKQITEGLASKPVASTKPSKEIISEGVTEMASRFKKLAGIKDAPKSK